VPFAVFALYASQASQKIAYGLLAVLLGFYSAYRIWSQEHEKGESALRELEDLKKKYVDERPVLGLSIVSAMGPQEWNDAKAAGNSPVHFSLEHLSGRPATSIHFKPVHSKLGRFALEFDSLAYVKTVRAAMNFYVHELAFPRISALGRDKIGNIDAQMLGVFLDDRDRNLGSLLDSFELTVTFTDGEEIREQAFDLRFDWSRYHRLFD
jgi:hypothetical protein